MTTRELEAFPTNTVIQNPVLVYPHVRVKDKDRVISSQSTSRAVKRNNSGVMYTVDNCVYYGILQKVILAKQCDGSQYYYALVLRLHQVMYFLCCDTVTNSKLNEHIIAFHPPW